MENEFSRTELLLGTQAVKSLAASTVAVFGIGGVGSFAAEGLARSGVGHLVLIDYDLITITNINRQLHATSQTVGLSKVEVMKNRILEINPRAQVTTHSIFYRSHDYPDLVGGYFDYIVDAIDSVAAKIDLILQAQSLNIPIISCMGAGNKLDPTCFEVADIYATSVCPLARVMRRELRKRDIKALKVVYSREVPLIRGEDELGVHGDNCSYGPQDKGSVPGSVVFVTATAGLVLAGEAVKDLTGMSS